MDPFDTYRTFLAVKRHFAPGSTFDFHKYGGKTNASVSSFQNRNDRFYFEKLAKKYDPLAFMVANVSENPNFWIGDSFTPAADARHDRWVRVTGSLTYVLKQEMALDDDLDRCLVFRDGKHPPALLAYLEGRLSPEVLHAVDELTGFTGHWEKYSWDPTVKQASHRIRKLKGFVKFDRERVSEALRNLFRKEASQEVGIE